MRTVERDIHRILTLLRNRIRQQGFTQLEVQEVNGWGKSYISQLVTKQKSLRVEHVLMILNVINIDPADFYAEIYQFGPSKRRALRAAQRRSLPPAPNTGDMAKDMRSLGILLDAVVNVLASKEFFSMDDYKEATKRHQSSHSQFSEDVFP